MQARERLIFALDVDTAAEAERLVRLLADEVGVFKVGLELFVSAGPEVISRVRAAGARSIFLDLKLHDIPATMAAAARAAARLGVQMLTCHADQAGIFEEWTWAGPNCWGLRCSPAWVPTTCGTWVTKTS